MSVKRKGRRVRVLLIDDDPEERLIVEDMLSGAGNGRLQFELSGAGRLDEGLALLKKFEPDLVLLDLQLPDAQGIETFSKLAHASPDVPVVILSLHYDDSLALEAVRRGAQDYIFKKEIQPDLLIRTIRFALERHELKRELDRANEQLEKLALIDPVTELFNRRGLQEILSREIQRARRRHSELLVLLVDLDDFKRINRILSHSVGDVVLKEVAAKLKGCLRSTDYIARVGGDEFLLLLPETRYAEAVRVGEKITAAVSNTMIGLSSQDKVAVTATLGIANVSELISAGLSPSLDELVAKIHVLLYESRQRQKKPRVAVERDSLLVELLTESETFHALMQPIVRLSDQAEIGYEFLTRSRVKGLELPDEFFRASLHANILTDVDRQCLRACVAAGAGLPSALRRHVNLFPSTMIGVPAEQILESLSDESPKTSYCLEISEQQIIGDPSYLIEPVEKLKREGVLIAIDDLGFGRSCLESIILLEPDIVKIDKRCVTGISKAGAPLRSLRRLLRMAKSLGAEVVAEGIESKDDLEVLRHMGVKYGQGFYLGRPREAEAPEVTPVRELGA